MRLVLVAAVCLSMVGLAVAADAHASIRMQTDIPAQGLGPALKALAKDRGFQVVFRTEVVGSARTHGVSGDLTTPEALTRLLEGTSLTYSYLDENTVTILPRAELESGSAVDRQSTPTGSGSSPGSKDKEGQKRSSFRLAQVDPRSSSGAASLTSAPASTEESKPSGGLPEIIVTAQKKSERLQDVPVPVSVLNADKLADTGQVLIRDYYASVPGLQAVTGIYPGSGTILSIRGVNSGGGPPTVGILIDDAPFGSSFGGHAGIDIPDIDPGDLARVEVLRGPQGVLYGSDSMGGLLKFVTKDPTPDAYSGRFETDVNSVQNGAEPGYGFRVSGNVPISSTAAIRASGFWRQDPGYVDNPRLGTSGVNEGTAYGGRLAGLWQPSGDFSIKLSALYQRISTDGSPAVVVEPGLGDLQQNFLPGGGYLRTTQAYSMTIKANAGAVGITSITAYERDKTDHSLDFTSVFGSAQLGTPIYNLDANRKFSEEIRLNGSLFDSVADWRLGGFYTIEKESDFQIANGLDPTTFQVISPGFFQYYFIGDVKYKEYAGFADVTWHVTDRFNVQFGGRESHLELDVPENAFVFDSPPAISPPENSSNNTFTYLVSPQVKVSRDLMIYARFASGFRPGTPNSGVQGVPSQTNPDRTKNYEFGLKGSFLDGRISTDASIYHIDYTGIQIELQTPKNPDGTGGIAYGANGGKAESEGAEVSISTRPITGLVVSGWVSYDKAVLTQNFPTTSTAYGQDGNRLPGSSRWSGNFSVQQDFLLGESVTGYVGGEASFVGDRLGDFRGFADPTNTTPAPRQNYPAYTRLDLRAGGNYQAWSLNLYLNNATNRRGLIGGGLDATPQNSFVYIQPRTVGLNVARTF